MERVVLLLALATSATVFGVALWRPFILFVLFRYGVVAAFLYAFFRMRDAMVAAAYTRRQS